MSSTVEKLKQAVSQWPHVTVHPHQFQAKEFRVNNAEVGHIHAWGTLDIPFPRSIHNVLLEEHSAEQHRFVPDSGWVTFEIHGDHDLDSALRLLRLSWLRYALKSEPDPLRLLKQETEQLHLSPRLGALLAQFVPWRAGASDAK
jgi:hypothetical protein